jgi:hypothetical protein
MLSYSRAPRLDQWSHVACGWDGTSVYVYVNGTIHHHLHNTLKGDCSLAVERIGFRSASPLGGVTVTTGTGGSMYVGWADPLKPGIPTNYYGLIDDLVYYNTPGLSDLQIKQLADGATIEISDIK